MSYLGGRFGQTFIPERTKSAVFCLRTVMTVNHVADMMTSYTEFKDFVIGTSIGVIGLYIGKIFIGEFLRRRWFIPVLLLGPAGYSVSETVLLGIALIPFPELRIGVMGI